jgi:hypothetical protein
MRVDGACEPRARGRIVFDDHDAVSRLLRLTLPYQPWLPTIESPAPNQTAPHRAPPSPLLGMRCDRARGG